MADGDWPDNDAFGVLSETQQLDELRAAVAWISPRQVVAPQWCRRVASAALYLMDSHAVDDVRLRMTLGVILGTAAQFLGEYDEAFLHFREIVEQPTEISNADLHIHAQIGYATILSLSEPEQALSRLESAARAALAAGQDKAAADAAVSLGSLQRRRGDMDGARQTYERALDAIEALGSYGREHILGRLHGNLGNVLTDDLGDHDKAIEHYSAAVKFFEKAGETSYAAQRYFHLVCAKLASGYHTDARRILERGIDRIPDGPDAFQQILRESQWLLSPPEELPAWVDLFEQIPNAHLDDEGQALLVWAKVLLLAQIGDDCGAIRLCYDIRLRFLPESTAIREVFKGVIHRLVSKYGCHGIMWPLVLLLDELPDDLRIAIRRKYLSETAAVWLTKQAEQVVRHGFPETNVAKQIAGPSVIYGLGAVSAMPSDWLGISDRRVRAAFTRLRGLCPTEEVLRGELLTFDGQHGEVAEGTVKEDKPSLFRAVVVADLLGEPELQVATRLSLARWISRRTDGAPRDLLREFMRILDEAGLCGEGIIHMEIRVHLATATLLKESQAGDEQLRIERSIREARHAWDLANEHGRQDVVPVCALTLANSLTGYSESTPDQIREAIDVLEHGRGVLDSGERDSFVDATMCNSLGVAHTKLGYVENPQQHLTAAIDYLEQALAVRGRLEDAERELTTISNLIGVGVRLTHIDSVSRNVRTLELAARARTVATVVDNPVARGTGLINVAKALQDSEPAEAVAIGNEALGCLRHLGPSRVLIEALFNVARVYIDSGDKVSARSLLEESVALIEDFRGESLRSRYRAELTASFMDVYEALDSTLAHLRAPVEDRWWSVDRSTGATLLESLAVRPSRESVVLTLSTHLPTGTVILQPYTNQAREVACFALRRRESGLVVQDIECRMPLREFATSTGGKVTKESILTRFYNPSQPDEFYHQLSWFGSNFLGPVMDEIDWTGVTRVGIAPRVLVHLPWHAVPICSLGGPLGRSFEVVTIPSAAVLARLLATPEPPLRTAAFVACDSSRSLQRHISECREAFTALSVKDRIVLTDTSRAITKQAVIELMKEADLFHFAGHSVMEAGQPEYSGLVLSDGLLTIPELESALGDQAPSVVYLSSCESSSEDSLLDDAPNISSVFLHTGARTVIGTSWRVPDSVAALTAKYFYEQLGITGPADALKHAQTTLMNRVTSMDWAYFRLQGWPAR